MTPLKLPTAALLAVLLALAACERRDIPQPKVVAAGAEAIAIGPAG